MQGVGLVHRVPVVGVVRVVRVVYVQRGKGGWYVLGVWGGRRIRMGAGTAGPATRAGKAERAGDPGREEGK